MIINYVEVEGFRGYKELQRLNFTDLNEITGGNGRGKSSVAEIISFGLLGVDKHGKERGADRLMNQSCTEFRIIINGHISGKEFEVDRHVIKLKGKTENRILLNGVQSAQDQIDSLIGNRRHFMASFLPKFLLGMTDKELEEEIVPLIPIPKQDDAIALLSEDDPEAAALLNGASLIDPNFYIKNQNAYLKEQKEELIRLNGSLDEVNTLLKSEIHDPIAIDKSGIESLKQTISSIESFKPQLLDVKSLEIERNQLLTQYTSLQRELNFDEHFINCDKCGHEINLNVEQEKRNSDITEQLVEIKQREQVLDKEIESAIQANKKANEEFDTVNSEALKELYAEMDMLEKNLELTQQHNMRVQVMKENQHKAKDRRAEIISQKGIASKVIENTEKLIKAAKAYNIKRCSLQVESVSKHLNRASIRLFELVKSTGEMKPAFKAEFDGKEVRLLSTSEEIHCFLEFSKLFREATQSNYPVFIDCAESIEDFERPDTQLFTARVVTGQSLMVNGEEVAYA